MLVATDAQRAARKVEMEAEDRERDKAREEAKKNRGFVQVYPKGWSRLQELIKSNPGAARIYAFLAEHIDATCGAVVVSQDVMAGELGIHVRTIQRHTRFLEEVGAVIRIKVGIGVYAYALDPHEVWRSWDDRKETSAFVTKTLVRTSDQENSEIRRRLNVMIKESSYE